MNIIKIDEFGNPNLDLYARTTENQLLRRDDPSKAMFIAESPKVIMRALDAGYEPVSVLVEDKHIETQAKEVLEKIDEDVPIYTAGFDVLSNLTGYKLTRGMLCAMKRKPLANPKDLCHNKNRIAILEDVMNPTNVGAIFRSAAALGIEAILLTKNSTDPLYRRAARVSMGTTFQIPYTYIDNDWNEDTMKELKTMGFKILSMALRNNSVDIDDPVLANESKLAIVLGTEGEGLNSKTIDNSDYVVKIPMSHQVDSLNVAAASAVIFWQLRK